MKQRAKAKKVFTIYGTYSNLVTYEYRGVRYEVEQNSGTQSPSSTK